MRPLRTRLGEARKRLLNDAREKLKDAITGQRDGQNEVR